MSSNKTSTLSLDQQSNNELYNDSDEPTPEEYQNDKDVWQDTELIDYWDASFKGYKSYHDKDEKNPAVLIPAPKKRPISTRIKQKQQTNEENVVTGMKRKRVSFDPQQEEEEENNKQQNDNDDTLVVPNKTAKNIVPETTNEEVEEGLEENEYGENEQQTAEEYQNQDQQQQQYDDYNNYYYYYQQQQQPYPRATAPPPPPPVPQSISGTNNGEDEAFANLIMAWYYSGYYTGYYQAKYRRSRDNEGH